MAFAAFEAFMRSAGMARQLPVANLFEHPEPNYTVTTAVCEFWSVVTTVPIAGSLLVLQAFRMNLGWRVKVLSIWIFCMYCCACFSHATMHTLAFRVTVGLVASQGCFVFSQYSYLMSLYLGNLAEPIGMILEGLIVAAVALVPQQLGIRGGHLSLGVIQTPPVFLGLLAARHIQGQHKEWVYDRLVSSGKLLLFAMALSFFEYYVWDAAPSVLPMLGGFPLVHITIHVVEQIGIYMYAISVAVLDAGEQGRILRFAPDPVLGILPLIVEDMEMKSTRVLGRGDNRGIKRKPSGNLSLDESITKAPKRSHCPFIAEPESKSALTQRDLPIPCVDRALLLDPEIRKNHSHFNAQLHKSYPDSALIRVLGERSCFLVKSRRLVVQILKDERNFSSHPWPDGRVIALNTMEPSKHAMVKKLLTNFYSPNAVKDFQQDFQRGIMEALCPNKSDACKSFCAVTWVGRMHMAGALRVLGGAETLSMVSDVNLLDKFVRMNDDMVRLVAPLGGIGKAPPSLLRDGLQPLASFLKGLVQATPPLLGLMARIGFMQTFAIVRPELNLYQGPSFPRTGTWQHPELIRSVPMYFTMLDELLTGVQEDRPLPCHSKGKSERGASTCLDALRDAERSGLLSRSESLAILVQLMVNITTRNAILNALYRLATDPELRATLSADRERINAFLHEVLRVDTPLQRTPKRALRNTHLDGTFIPKDSTLLLLLGAANMSPEGCEGDPNSFCPFAQNSRSTKEHHVAFGPGARYCLGQHLVMMEMTAIVNFVLDNAPHLRVVGPTERVHDMDVGNFGWSKLNLAF